MTSSSREVKRALRQQVHKKISSLSHDDIVRQSLAAQHVIISSPQYVKARSVGVYLNMPDSEAQTDLILRNALDCRKKVYVPYIYSIPKLDKAPGKRRVMDLLHITSIEEYQALHKDSWGIPSLPSDSVSDRSNALGGKGLSFDDTGKARVSTLGQSELDMIIMPGVAFDGDMCRLGHGGGFYDGYLTRLTSQTERGVRPWLVGLCLAEQVLVSKQIKMESWDWHVDAVATGDSRLLTSD